MYIYIYIYIYIHIVEQTAPAFPLSTYTYAYKSTYIHIYRGCVYACVCVCEIRKRACTHACVCVCMHVCMCAHEYKRVYVCMNECVCMSTCVQARLRISHTYACPISYTPSLTRLLLHAYSDTAGVLARTHPRNAEDGYLVNVKACRVRNTSDSSRS
jgi:hypothetical protein